MTKTEAGQFVKDILQGLWPRWNPNDAEIEFWVKGLWRFDYGRAKRAVYQLFENLDSRRIEPPAGKIMAVLKAYAYTKIALKKRGAIRLFTLVKESDFNEGRLGGYDFAVPVPPAPPQEEVERRAEQMRNKFNYTYGCKCVIVYAKIEREEAEPKQEQPDDEIPF